MRTLFNVFSISIPNITLCSLVLFTPLRTRGVVTVGIGDGTFAPGNWSQFLSSSAAGTTASFSQVASGGNPGSFGRINLTILNPGNSYLMTWFTGQSYSPLTQGPISSIDFSADFRAITFGDIFFGFKQGGSSYFLKPPPFTDVYDANWFHVSYTQNTESMFGDIFTYAAPNFTSGAPLQFGIYMGYTTTGSDTMPFSIGMDNFQVTITTVPEPAAMLVAPALVALIRQRRNAFRPGVCSTV